MSDDDKQSIFYKQRIEELQKQLIEEKEIKDELLRRAKDVLQSIKQLRDMYNKEKEEKELLEEKIQNFQKSGFVEGSRSERDTKEWSEVNDTTHELERLRAENEEIKRTLSKKPSVEPGTITDPELLEATTINEKLVTQLSELTEAKNDLQYLREEQAKSIQSADDIPFGQTNLCFVMTVEEAKVLANKIKKLQVELWDLEISHQQLQTAHTQALEHKHSGGSQHNKQSSNSGSDILSHNTNRDIYGEMALMEDDEDDTEDDRRVLENKYYLLLSSVAALREQAQTCPVEQGVQVLNSFYQLMKRLVDEKGLAGSGFSSDLERLEFSKVKKQKSGRNSGTMDDNEKRMSLKPLQVTKVSSKEFKEKHRPKTARNSSSSKSKKKKESKEKVDF